jgi:hypothetical protein
MAVVQLVSSDGELRVRVEDDEVRITAGLE